MTILEKFVPQKQKKEVISMRIPVEVLQEIDRQAGMINISRNEFINQCITFALDNMEHKA